MAKSKNWWQSKTIQGGLVSMFVMFSALLDIDLDSAFWTETIQLVFGVIGSLMVIYGRVTAIHNIK